MSHSFYKEDHGVPFVEAEGEAAFYGPKIDIQAKNVYGKEDTMITIQLDCAIAENFDMYYIDQNGDKQLHRNQILPYLQPQSYEAFHRGYLYRNLKSPQKNT